LLRSATPSEDSSQLIGSSQPFFPLKEEAVSSLAARMLLIGYARLTAFIL
jgi:hypothetical protein